MKKIAIATLAITAVLSQAKATTGAGLDILTENGTSFAALEHCGGQAVLLETYEDGVRKPMLRMSGINNCSVVLEDGVEIGHIKGGKGGGDVVLNELPGRNIHTIIIRSGSKKTEDIVQVRSFGESKKVKPARDLTPNIEANFGFLADIFGADKVGTLPSCRGEVTVSQRNGSNITLVFRNMSECSKFDILNSNGEPSEYKVQPLQREYDGQFGGSVTIPRRYVEAGGNSIIVVVKSNSGAHDDIIRINFLN